MAEGDHNIAQRKEKILSFLKTKSQWLYFLGLAFVVWFGAFFIRTANVSRLKDVTGGWALAPDLDPYLFLRWAKLIIANGSLPIIDTFRYVPVGYSTAGETPFVPYAIAWTYKIMAVFSSTATIEYAAIMMPVIFFVFTLIACYIMVRKIFQNNSWKDAMALVSTLLLAVIPGFIHRTVAGVPEKESAAFVFMFLSIYFLACAWHEEKWKKASVYGFLAGLMTGIMGLAWGGVPIMFVIVSLGTMAYFFTSGFKDKDGLAHGAWLLGFSLLLIPQERYGFGIFLSTTSSMAYFAFALFSAHFALHRTRLGEKLNLKRFGWSEKLITLVVVLAIGLLFILILNPGMVLNLFNDIKSQLITPFEGDRVTVSIAENGRPFFDSWYGSFGKFFWVFFFGSAFLLYDYCKKMKGEHLLLLVVSYLIMLSGMTFTRLNPNSVFNGDSPLSVILFMCSGLLFLISAIYIYSREENLELESGVILLLAWTVFGLLAARGAVRLLYFLYPIVAVIGGYASVRVAQIAYEETDKGKRLLWICIAAFVVALTAWTIYNYSIASYNEVNYGTVPSSYNIQWQKAMGWIRDNTSKDAVFAHWWDYGYWVQTMGNRPTVLDGGNAVVYWDHLMGRSLTAQNETEALEFYKMHNVSYLLIDSTDIEKYTAFSSIGSDENYDRYSYMSTFYYDAKSTQEKRNETLYALNGGGVGFDEDIVYKDKIFALGSGGIAGFILPIERIGSTVTGKLNQPYAIVVFNGQQMQVPIKCVYLDGKINFAGEGIDGCLYIVPQVTDSGVQKIGAGIWLSPRLMRSEFTKLYFFDEGKNFELAHSENYPVVDDLNSRYNLGLPGLSVVQGQLLGPIKIWKVSYPADIAVRPEYLELDYPKDRPGLWEIKR